MSRAAVAYVQAAQAVIPLLQLPQSSEEHDSRLQVHDSPKFS